MFVRLFVDENLDRMVPISRQPREKVQAIIGIPSKSIHLQNLNHLKLEINQSNQLTIHRVQLTFGLFNRSTFNESLVNEWID